MNKAVLERFSGAPTKGLPISGPMLQEKAHKFDSGLCIEILNGSNGWLDRFTFNAIVFQQCVGESADMN